MNEGNKMLHPLLSGIFIGDQNGTNPPSPNFKLQTRVLLIPPLPFIPFHHSTVHPNAL